MTERSGYELPLLMVGAFRAMVDRLHEELADRGHAQARPLHGFALQAIGAEGISISELGRRLGVSKQAAAKTVEGLELAGYASRHPDIDDQRVWVVRRTRRGEELLELSATIFDEQRAGWVADLGEERVVEVEEILEVIAADGEPGGLGDLPGWLRGTA